MIGTFIGEILKGAATSAASGAVQSQTGVRPGPNTSIPQTAAGTSQSPASQGPGGMTAAFNDMATGILNRVGDQTIDRALAPLQGEAAGKYAKSYYDKAFPGSSTWDRLGASNPSGQNAQASAQERMQTKELKTRKDIARLQTNAQIKSALISSEAPMRQASVAEAKLPIEVQNLSADTRKKLAEQLSQLALARLTGHKATLEGAKVRIKDLLAEAGLAREVGSGVVSAFYYASRNPEEAAAVSGALTKPAGTLAAAGAGAVAGAVGDKVLKPAKKLYGKITGKK